MPTDTERMDWLVANGSRLNLSSDIVSIVTRMRNNDPTTLNIHVAHNLRAAIDAAMSEPKATVTEVNQPNP